MLSRDGGSTVELGRVANTNRIGLKTGCRQRKNNDGSGGAACFTGECDGAGVSTRHVLVAARDINVLLRRGEAVRSRPVIGGTRLSCCGQMDGFADTVGTVVVDQRRQDAAVGGSRASVREGNVTWRVGIVGNQQNVILTHFRIVDMAVLGSGGAVAAVHDVAASKFVASRIDVIKRSPAVEVDINGRGTLHVNIQIARLCNSHEIESRIGGSGKAV